jgi:SAM-dependent methyltransferase
MQLLDIVQRSPAPVPWSEGDNIPWHEPEFSARMLHEHLAQEHDAASRRTKIIARHVHWIHHHILAEQPARILDLGCGPGLYAHRLGKLGHDCVGIDYSPASIAYARDRAQEEGLAIRYVRDDIRTADYGSGFGLVMLIYGEFNVFGPADANHLLRKAYQALHEGGVLLLEPHTSAIVQEIGEKTSTWYTARQGLFSDQPYLCLQEHFWDKVHQASTIRYWIVDAARGTATRYAQSFQSYTDDQYRALLHGKGFDSVETYPSLGGDSDTRQDGLFALVGRKRQQAQGV